MADFIGKVIEFNAIAGQTEQFNARNVALYTGLVLEEVAEVIESFNCPELGQLQVALQFHSKRFKEGEFDKAAESIDRLNAVKESGDVAVVAVGLGMALGSDVNGAFNNVADSNLSKYEIDPSTGERIVLRDEHGKVKKPPSYKQPSMVNYMK